MKLAVTDANIFIDLIHIDCLHYLFQLKIELHTTVEVLEELHDHQKEEVEKYVKTRQLILDFGANYKREIPYELNTSLAEADKSVFYYAWSLKAGVLTGDNVLKRSLEKHLEVHGILWILERFVLHNFLTGSEACEKLGKLLEYKCRLPKKECEKLMKMWREK